MVWLYRSPVPVGEEGGYLDILLVQIISTCLRRGYKWGGGGGTAPCCGLSLEDMVKTASHVIVSSQKVIRIQMLTLWCVRTFRKLNIAGLVYVWQK